MPASSTRNNILAGGFLIFSVALGVAASFVLSDAAENLRSTREYTVRFSIADGASGIRAGSQVLLGGQPVGKVVDVTIVPDQPAPANRPPNSSSVIPGGIDIRMRIDARYTFYDNAEFYLEKPLLGSLTALNIASMGIEALVDEPIGPTAILEPGELIRGLIAPPSFLSQAGLGSEQVLDIKQMIAQAKDAVEKINVLIDQNAELVTGTMTDVRAGAGDARAAIKGVTDKVPGWTESADRIMANADETARSFPRLRDGASGVLDDAKAFVADARAVVSDNRPKIDRIIDNVDATASTVRENAEPIARAARDSLGSFEDLSRRLDTIVATETPNIRRTLANARLASDQLKLTMLEVRAQPWRLLVQPDTKELREQLLYDSARSYASAVSDLRAASESLESLIAPASVGGEGAASSAAASSVVAAPVDLEQIRRRMQELDEAFARYRKAEDTLFEKLSNGR